MTVLAEAREFLERAMSQTLSRADELALGERICDVQELEECRQLRLIKRRTHRQGVAFPVEVIAA